MTVKKDPIDIVLEIIKIIIIIAIGFIIIKGILSLT